MKRLLEIECTAVYIWDPTEVASEKRFWWPILCYMYFTTIKKMYKCSFVTKQIGGRS